MKRNVQTASRRVSLHRRMALVGLGFTAGFGFLATRGVLLHLSGDEKLERLARSQYHTRIPEAPPRGRILDSSGEELANSVPTVSLAVRPGRVGDRGQLARFLRQVLDLSEGEILRKLKSERPYVWVKRHLSPAESRRLEGVDLPGIELVKESRRFYPNRELASHVLGAVGGDGEGLSGVELFYDRDLRKERKGDWTLRDARGQFLDTVGEGSGEAPADLTLTVSQAIQFVTESELKAVCDERQAKSCVGMVLDPRTGAVLAMASVPTFNPNAYSDFDLDRWRNRAVTDTFEPGSIFKVITAAAALESGLVHPEDRFFCERGTFNIGGNVLHDHDPYGLLSFREILQVSSNIGFYKVGLRTGRKRVEETIRDFGFGQKSGIDFPGEQEGFVRPLGAAREIEFANVTFGQGVRVTPLQMASAFATIANGGVRMRPGLVSKVTDREGRVLWRANPVRRGRVLSPETARVLTSMLTAATEEGGTGRQAAIPGYSVAGKTGTAQKFENGRYSHTKFSSSFVGFVPAEDPAVVVLVVVDEPRGQYYGGSVAAPVFRRIAWAALRELGVPPERVVPRDAGLPEITQASLIQASLINWPVGGMKRRPGDPVTMPDMTGLSKREVLALLEAAGVKGEVRGSGVVIRQEPVAGGKLTSGMTCRVTLSTEP